MPSSLALTRLKLCPSQCGPVPGPRPTAIRATAGSNVSAFLWDGVVDDANIHGYQAMAVPGAVAGLGRLHERHGRLPWRDLVLPAVQLAREGFELSWFDTMYMESTALAGRRHPELQRRFYPNGEPPQSDHMETIRITQPELAATLDVLAEDGVDAFYQWRHRGSRRRRLRRQRRGHRTGRPGRLPRPRVAAADHHLPRRRGPDARAGLRRTHHH